jgi:uncharacterized membrane protein YdbT with pleckstrin-like domain
MPDIFIAKGKTEKKTAAGAKIILKKGPIKYRRNRLWSAFIRRPINLRFETQDKEEKIILMLRQHPVTNLPWLLLAILMFWVPFIVTAQLPLNFIPGNFRFVSFLCWYLFTFAFVFEKFLIWFFNVYILTDERIIDIDFPTLLYRSIKEAKIDRVQDVSIKTGGYFRSLFNFGDVVIQTAGAVPEICFEAIPNPEQVSHILNELMLEEEQEKLDGRAK